MDKEVVQIEQQLISTISLLQELRSKEKALNTDPDASECKSFETHKAEFIKKFQSEIIDSKALFLNEVSKIIQNFDNAYNKVASEIISEIEDGVKPEKVDLSSRIFSQKVHKNRRSLLIQMYQNEDTRTVYHIFIATMLVLMLGEMLDSYFNKGIFIDLSLFRYVFGNMVPVALFWLGMTGWCFLIVPLVRMIAEKNLPRVEWISIYAVFQLMLYIVACSFCLYQQLPMGSGFIITCEMVRMSLKAHSYLREKLLFGNGDNEYSTFIPESLLKKGVTIKSLNIPKIQIKDLATELKRFLYFFFAPTLIYRDSYPRIQSQRRYSMIFVNALNVAGTIFYTFVIFQGSCVPYFQSTWREEYNFKFILVSWFKAMIPATMLLILMFFGLLHSWFNLWAEILLYGDREFYEDWWNVSNFADYYRKWNIVVHEWLFHYIYQDLIRFTKGKVSKLTCFFAVFLISALIHELILAFSMKFFYPILLIMFGGPGVIYTFFSRKDIRALNVFVWSMFFVGNGVLVVFYSWEHFARQSVDLSGKYGWKSFFIPHSWASIIE